MVGEINRMTSPIESKKIMKVDSISCGPRDGTKMLKTNEDQLDNSQVDFQNIPSLENDPSFDMFIMRMFYSSTGVLFLIISMCIKLLASTITFKHFGLVYSLRMVG